MVGEEDDPQPRGGRGFDLTRRDAVRVVTAGALAGSIGPGPAAADEHEEVQFGETYTGELQSEDDEDKYKLAVNEGDVCEFRLEKEPREDLRAALDWPNDGTGLQGESEEELIRRVTVDETGYVYVDVYGWDMDDGESYAYSLTPTVERGVDRWPGEAYDEVEFGGTYEGTIQSPDDRDRVRFSVDEGDVCEFRLGKAPREDVRMVLEWPNDATGLQGESEEELIRRVTVDETGHVDLEVYGWDMGDTETHDWSLTASVERGADRWSGETYEEVGFGETYRGTVNSPDDGDRYRLAVNEGDVCEFRLEKAPREDVRMVLDWPNDGTGLQGESEEVLTRRVTVDETDYVDIEIYGWDMGDTETYEYSLTPTVERGVDRWPGEAYEDVSSGEAYRGTIHSPDDSDRLRTTIDEGESASVELAKQAGDDVRLILGWPGGSTALQDESADLLTETVTADANDYLELQVYGWDLGDTETYDWTLGIDASAEVSDPASFDVSGIDPNAATTAPGERFEVSAEVTNEGGQAGTAGVEAVLDGEVVETSDLSLDPGQSETVTFEFEAPAEAGTYTYEIATGDGAAAGSLTVEAPSDPASFEVSDLDPESITVTRGAPLLVAASIENVGDEAGSQSVELRVGGEPIASRTVELDGGELTTVSFEVETEALDPGEYAHGVATEDDSRSGSLTVEAQEDESGESESEDGNSGPDDETNGSADSDDGGSDDADGDDEATAGPDESGSGATTGDSGDGTDDEAPGPGIVGTLASIGGLGYLLSRRVDGDGSTPETDDRR